MSHLLSSLNDAQAQAVSAPPSHCLVLAGAGSGKTRVLVHRIAWLMETTGARPMNFLAVTFTNKAAGEMRDRLAQLVPGSMGHWVGTFHGLAHRLLRLHPMEAGLPASFQVLDADDQLKMVRQIVRDMQLDDETYPPRQVASWISSQKEEGHTPKTVRVRNSIEQTQAEVFQVYEERCQLSGLVDFAGLLLLAHQMLKNTPALLHHYAHRFSHILVDEFQDTNAIQYEFIRLLSSAGANVFVVGDDDQAIYGWRGAKVENVQKFLEDYPGATLFKLEENYRSTGIILDAANALISHNTGRLGKKLWTEGDRGEPIGIHECANEVDEASYVARKIQSWSRNGGSLDDCAILYRSNAQSRALEEQLMMLGIPYRIYGGLKFFERAEIKDAMAYLRLVASPVDDAAFERVINVPARSLGEKSVQKIRDVARANHQPMWHAARTLLAKGGLAPKAAKSLQGFLDGLDLFSESFERLPLAELVDDILVWSGLKEHHAKEGRADADKYSRTQNLEELVSVASRFCVPDDQGDDMPVLVSFLSHAALEAGERGTGANEDEPCVQMMTLHAAKGLEFPMVFMVGMEDGLFPSARAVQEDDRLDEERRLAYVGITRAMKKLVMTYTKERRVYGQWIRPIPSGFLSEIPSDLTRKTKSNSQSGGHQGGRGGYQGYQYGGHSRW